MTRRTGRLYISVTGKNRLSDTSIATPTMPATSQRQKLIISLFLSTFSSLTSILSFILAVDDDSVRIDGCCVRVLVYTVCFSYASHNISEHVRFNLLSECEHAAVLFAAAGVVIKAVVEAAVEGNSFSRYNAAIYDKCVIRSLHCRASFFDCKLAAKATDDLLIYYGSIQLAYATTSSMCCSLSARDNVLLTCSRLCFCCNMLLLPACLTRDIVPQRLIFVNCYVTVCMLHILALFGVLHALASSLFIASSLKICIVEESTCLVAELSSHVGAVMLLFRTSLLFITVTYELLVALVCSFKFVMSLIVSVSLVF